MKKKLIAAALNLAFAFFAVAVNALTCPLTSDFSMTYKTDGLGRGAEAIYFWQLNEKNFKLENEYKTAKNSQIERVQVVIYKATSTVKCDYDADDAMTITAKSDNFAHIDYSKLDPSVWAEHNDVYTCYAAASDIGTCSFTVE